MLARKHTFSPTNQFFSLSQKCVHIPFVLYVKKHTSTQICVSISKKTAPSAVVRNMIKRQLLAVVRSEMREGAMKNIQIVITLNRKMHAKKLSQQQLAIFSQAVRAVSSDTIQRS